MPETPALGGLDAWVHFGRGAQMPRTPCFGGARHLGPPVLRGLDAWVSSVWGAQMHGTPVLGGGGPDAWVAFGWRGGCPNIWVPSGFGVGVERSADACVPWGGDVGGWGVGVAPVCVPPMSHPVSPPAPALTLSLSVRPGAVDVSPGPARMPQVPPPATATVTPRSHAATTTTGTPLGTSPIPLLTLPTPPRASPPVSPQGPADAELQGVALP